VADIVDDHRAARAGIGITRLQHVVVDDELAAAVEQVEQAHLAVWTLEGVLLLDPDHRQPPALRCQRIPGPSGLLLFDQQRRVGGLPLGWRHDMRKVHRALLSGS
jgi:hypothetical protein